MTKTLSDLIQEALAEFDREYAKGFFNENPAKRGYKHFLEQKLRSVAEAVVERWQSIETAPKTGEHILVAMFEPGFGWGTCGGKRQSCFSVVHWWDNPGEEGFYRSLGGTPDEVPAKWTHWKPLEELTSTFLGEGKDI